jgi:gluconate 5-dehydrogenase
MPSPPGLRRPLRALSTTALTTRAANSPRRRCESWGTTRWSVLSHVASKSAVTNAFDDLDAQAVEIDIVVNNAGIQHRQPLVDLALADWQRVIDTNPTSAFLVGREAARRMIARKRGGKIINIGSLTGELACATVAPCTAAKGGIKLLTKSMAAEWAEPGIQANAISPATWKPI